MSVTQLSPVESAVGRERGLRWWIVAVIGVCALAIGALIGSAIDSDDDTSDLATRGEAGAPVSEPEQVINRYNAAWEEHDSQAVLAVVTDDFVEEYHWYTQVGDQIDVGSENWGASAAASYASTSDFRIELSGDAIVVGDGPWFVSVAESQTGGGNAYEGTTSYVVVDDDGTLKLSRKSWLGWRQPLTDSAVGQS